MYDNNRSRPAELDVRLGLPPNKPLQPTPLCGAAELSRWTVTEKSSRLATGAPI
jgi:hypothetical protein